jgi:hypothetical protein
LNINIQILWYKNATLWRSQLLPLTKANGRANRRKSEVRRVRVKKQ